MGFFSWNCPCCSHSARSAHATNRTSAWMSKVVVCFKNGDRLSGEYDGYGRIGDMDDDHSIADRDGTFTLYHRACWELAGKPGFTKPSTSARDQGFFVGEYDPTKPKTIEDVKALSEAATSKREEDRRKAREAMAKARAECVARGEEIPFWLQERAEPPQGLINLSKVGG